MPNTMDTKPHKYDVSVEAQIAKVVIDDEYEFVRSDRSADNAEFESLINMLECKRTEKNYDWMSDIFIPELPATFLTDASNWVAQYFQSRDFVEVKLDGENPDDDKKAKAAKLVINKTLNRRDLYHYHKYVRGRTINAMAGHVYAICWWDQEVRSKRIGMRDIEEPLNVDIYGKPIISPEQIPAVRINQVPVYAPDIIRDGFQYEIIDPRNVFTDRKYCYSIQEKDWVSVRSEVTYEQLKKNEKKMGYFNLHLVKDLSAPDETETANETYNKEDTGTAGSGKPLLNRYDKILRFGEMWAVVKERFEDGFPRIIEPGYDFDGTVKDGAEIVDTLIEFVVCAGKRVMIRFQVNPNRDARGRSFKPLVRGWCYIHPTKDSGLSDGKMEKEIQVGINDVFNLGMDRTKLATLPTLKGKKYSLEDNTTIFFKPEHVMEVEDPNDIQEFKLQDDITGAMNVIGMLQQANQKAVAIFPTTMGALPAESSQTATATAGAESRSNVRANYKSLTWEYTFAVEFYWMILQMFWRFARPETALKMLGEDLAEIFDPDLDCTYTPVSSNIETEYSKMNKLRIIDQFVGRLVQVQNPNTMKVLNYLMSLAFEAFNREFPEYKKYLFDETAPPPGAEEGAAPPAQGGGGAMPPMAPTNQTGMTMSLQEETARLGIGL